MAVRRKAESRGEEIVGIGITSPVIVRITIARASAPSCWPVVLVVA